MIAMLVPLLAFAAQEVPDPRPPFRATMTIERFVKRQDRATVESGDLSVRPGDALVFQSGRLRMLIRGGKALERRAGERTVTAWNLAKPENFQPLDLWRLDPASIRERFRELRDPAGAARELPPAVLDAEGKPIAPVPVRPPAASPAWSDGVDRAEGFRRVILVPREPELRARITSIRLSVDRATGRLWSAVVDCPSQIVTLTLGDLQEAASMEGAVFEWDLSTLNVEDR